MRIIESIEQMFFANFRYLGSLNSSFYQSGSILAMHSGVACDDLNMAWNEKPLSAKDSKTIQDIKNFYQKVKLPFWWWVFPCGQSQTTIDMLKAEGFSLVVQVPSLLADLTALSIEKHGSSLKVIQAGNKEEISWWEEVSFAGFDFQPETRQQFHKFISTFNTNPDSPQKIFLALLNEKPVATTLLFLNKKSAGIYFVSTLPEYRKKGIGLALTLATMSFAKQAGAEFATLQSSPDGLRVYKQAGFKEYCKADIYSLTAIPLPN
ncbi:MAG: GNAT family N-acetyltransferase [Smithella sp.]